MNRALLLCAATSLFLSGCGTDPTKRTLTGAGIGAGVGAVGSTIVGGSTLGGAVVGGAVGAATGGLTDPDDINLGD